jgi:MYXO-CTERM domain-containing protein
VNVCRLDEGGEAGSTGMGDVTRAKSESGCGCRTAGPSRQNGAGLLLLGLGVVFTLRRRRAAFGLLSSLFLLGSASCKKDVQATVNEAPDGNNDQGLVDCSDANEAQPLAGPTMVPVGRSDDSCVWIDTTEVTSEQFVAFAELATDEYERHLPAGCASEKPDPSDFTASRLPATGVTWCAAAGYCAWAGKRLCLDEGGASEWQTVCTDGDHEGFDYEALIDACQTNTNEAASVASLDQCGTPTGVHDQVGNAREWTGECSGDAPSGTCKVRGGSYLDSGTAIGCKASKSVERSTTAPDLGFRCCADVP